ncbi:MAG: uL30 family ribosomal protein [Candidatus Woesearchaeota archaeon]
MAKLAVVRVRGQVRVHKGIARALEQLNLRKRHHATIVEESPAVIGQLKKVQSYVTWGPVSEEVAKKLATRGRGNGRWFALHPPCKGYGRKGIKMPFSKGGALGNRGEKINYMLLRMI